MTEEEFIVVDHVYDPVIHKRSRLLNPLVFKLSQDQVLQLYGLNFVHMVNSEAREEVLNKNVANFTGCDTTSFKPTCGMSYIKDKVIPFSEGFCCSCDAYVNMKRQPTNRMKEANHIGFSYSNLGLVENDMDRVKRSFSEEDEGNRSKNEANEMKQKNVRFFGRTLWGSMYDSGFQEVQPFRVQRSTNESSTNSGFEIKNDTETGNNFDNGRVNAAVHEIKAVNKVESDDILKDEPDNAIFDWNEGNDVRSSDDLNFDMIRDETADFCNCSYDNEELDFCDDNRALLFGNDWSSDPVQKPWLLESNNKFNTFLKRFKVKDKKPLNMSDLVYNPSGIQLRHYDNPPLEIARGFWKSDFKTSCCRHPSPWSVPTVDHPVQPFGRKRNQDCHKYIHILSKLIERGIDLEHDLKLAPKDIIESCREPEKNSRFIKSVIRKAERKLKNQNIIENYYNNELNPLAFKRRYLNKLQHCRYRRDNENRYLSKKTINNFRLYNSAGENISMDNVEKEQYVLDIVWTDNLIKFTQGDNSNFSTAFNASKELLLRGPTQNDYNDSDVREKIDVVWVKSFDYNSSLDDSVDERLTQILITKDDHEEPFYIRDELSINVENEPNNSFSFENVDGVLYPNDSYPFLEPLPIVTTNETGNISSKVMKDNYFNSSNETIGCSNINKIEEHDCRADIKEDNRFKGKTYSFDLSEIMNFTESNIMKVDSDEFYNDYNNDTSNRNDIFDVGSEILNNYTYADSAYIVNNSKFRENKLERKTNKSYDAATFNKLINESLLSLNDIMQFLKNQNKNEETFNKSSCKENLLINTNFVYNNDTEPGQKKLKLSVPIITYEPKVMDDKQQINEIIDIVNGTDFSRSNFSNDNNTHSSQKYANLHPFLDYGTKSNCNLIKILDLQKKYWPSNSHQKLDTFSSNISFNSTSDINGCSNDSSEGSNILDNKANRICPQQQYSFLPYMKCPCKCNKIFNNTKLQMGQLPIRDINIVAMNRSPLLNSAPNFNNTYSNSVKDSIDSKSLGTDLNKQKYALVNVSVDNVIAQNKLKDYFCIGDDSECSHGVQMYSDVENISISDSHKINSINDNKVIKRNVTNNILSHYKQNNTVFNNNTLLNYTRNNFTSNNLVPPNTNQNENTEYNILEDIPKLSTLSFNDPLYKKVVLKEGLGLDSLVELPIINTNMLKDPKIIGEDAFSDQETIEESNAAELSRMKEAVNGTKSDIDQKKRSKKTKLKKKKKRKKKVKRQILSSGVQYRGGQSCIDRSTPNYANPITYHESAHCLRFSDLWYTVYKLKRPFIQHAVHLQLFEKHNHPDGRTHWQEVTKGINVNIGTFVRHVRDRQPTIAFTYIPFTDQTSGVFCLDPGKTTLLVPQPVPADKVSEYPQAEAGPKQYLLVRDEELTLDGEECDKAGVSFEAFSRQPDRCAQPRGTCLKNQPIDMWRQDMEARRNNRPGKYFLDNYASIPPNPFKMNQSTRQEYLALEYMGKFVSAIEVEVRSDLNAIVRTGAAGQLTEIYVDATCEFHTRITIIVTNLGLASSAYFPKLSNCPVEIPDVWTHNEGPLINIAPQHRHIFRMSLYGSLPVDRFHCSVELLNDKRELVGTRRVRVQRHDRCLCQWHCLCACIGSIHGLECEPMSTEHYHAAGFQGSLPVITSNTGSDEGSLLWRLFHDIMIYCACALNIFYLGLLKALLGICCCSAIGSWGLWMILPGKAKDLTAYLEPQFADCPMKWDAAGYAIHPVNGTRNVRIVSVLSEFCINVLFFIIAPFAIAIKLIKICCPCICTCGQQPVEEDVDKTVKVEPDEELDEETKQERIKKAKKQKLLGTEHSDSESDWSLPSDLEFDEIENDNDAQYVRQEREESIKNLQETKSDTLRTRGGADSILLACDSRRESSLDSGKLHRENLSDLEKEMAEHLVDTLQEAYVVYRKMKNPVGGVTLAPGTSYCVRGYFSKTDSTYQFTLSPPALQYWDSENHPLIPPLNLEATDFEAVYLTAEDVLLANELSLLPRGMVINVWHTLDTAL